MDAQGLRNLQEAYMEVYEENMEKSPRNKEKAKEKSQQRKDRRLRIQYYGKSAVGHGTGEQLTPTQKEQVDLYDIILSHLLDEGYAETPESAEVIMVNMSEEWRGEIVEGYKKFPAKKIANKIDRMYNDPNIDNRFGKDAKRRNEMMRVSSHMKGEVHPLIRSESPKKSKAKESENKAKLKYKK
jgi:hypothetical protein